MKISNLFLTNKYYQQQNFCSNDNEWHVYGIDEGAKAKRDYIRQWHEQHYIPYQRIYEKEGRKSEYELQKMISYLVKKPIPVNNDKLNKIGLVNLQQIGDKFYRGAMLFGKNIDKVSKLKDAGIRTIVDLEGSKELREECLKNDVRYFHLNVDGIGDAFHTETDIRTNNERMYRGIANYNEIETQKMIDGLVKTWKKNSRNYIKKFVKFINTMQQNNVYIGCEFGTFRTDTALFFDYLFNPKPHNDSLPIVTKYNLIQSAENLYHNLTDIDKQKMGWTKTFDEQFLSKLETLKVRY